MAEKPSEKNTPKVKNTKAPKKASTDSSESKTESQTGIKTQKTIIEVRLKDLRYGISRLVRKSIDKNTKTKYCELWGEYFEELKDYEKRKANGKQEIKKPVSPFPPIKVAKRKTESGKIYEVVSGEIRSVSAEEANAETILAELIEGGDGELLERAIIENRKHGRPFSSEDIVCCVKSLKETYGKITIREIAKLTGSSKSTVGRILSQMGQNDAKGKKSFDLVAFCETMTKRIEKNADCLTEESVASLVDHMDRIIQILDTKELGDSFLEQMSERLRKNNDETAEQ